MISIIRCNALRGEKMKLKELISCLACEIDEQHGEIEIKGISTNSKETLPNELFVAIQGYQTDGHQYIDNAIAAGAIAVVGEKKLDHVTVPYFQIENGRSALAQLACTFYNHPSKRKTMIGITGTNGKTTTSYMLKHILESTGNKCALFGTVQNEINGKVCNSANTTPCPLQLNKQLNASRDEYILMEVSSHGIAQHRVTGVEFDYCLFTNLDHDHLDFHKTIDDYFSVKARLFDQMKPTGRAIINRGDRYGEILANRLLNNNSTFYSMGDKPHHDLHLTSIQTRKGTFALQKNSIHTLQLQIDGKHNILNAALAFLTASKIGIPPEEIIQALESFSGVPGRFEKITHPKGTTIIVDYAHTADAFNYCLETAKEEGANRIFHVFGFRGNRDTTKRKDMIQNSKSNSDVQILTFDDLNDLSQEEMKEALEQVNDGCLIIPDRTLAIQKAIDEADANDWVFITGKGAEMYQQDFELPTSSDIDTVNFLVEQ